MKINIRLLIPLLILFLAYGTRLFYYLDNPIQWRDSFFYKEMVETWERNDEYPSKDKYNQENTIPPFPLYIFMLVHKTFHKSIFVSNVSLQIVLGSITVLVLWFILREINIGLIPSALICLIAVFHKMFLDFSTQMTRDNLYIFFSSLFLYTIIKSIKSKKNYYPFLLGVLLAFVYLTRYEGIEFLIVYPAILAIQKTLVLKRMCLFFLLFCASFIFTLVSIYYTICPNYNFTIATHVKFKNYYSDLTN